MWHTVTIRITRTRAILAGAIAAVAAGATAYASIPDSSGVIHGCFKSSTGNQGALRVIDTDKGQTCANGETPISWNQHGPTGSKGATGARGPTGSRGATGTRGPTGSKGATGIQGQRGPTGPKGDKGDPGAGSLNGQPCTLDGAPGEIRDLVAVPPSSNGVGAAQIQMGSYCVSTDAQEPNDSQDTATPLTNWTGSIGGQLASSCGTIFPASDVDWYSAASTALTTLAPMSVGTFGCGTAAVTSTLHYDVYRDGVLVAQDVTQYQAPDSTVHSWLFHVSAAQPTAYEILLRRPNP